MLKRYANTWKRFCVCKYSMGQVEMQEIVSSCEGLATTFILKCKQPQCISHTLNNDFFASPLSRKLYQIKWNSALASRIIGKVHNGF